MIFQNLDTTDHPHDVESPQHFSVTRSADQCANTLAATNFRIVPATHRVIMVDRKTFGLTCCAMACVALAALCFVDRPVFGTGYAVDAFDSLAVCA